MQYTQSRFHSGYLKSLVQKYDYIFEPSDIVAGQIFSIESNGIMVDVGGNSSAYLPIDQLPLPLTNFLYNNQNLYYIKEFYVLDNNKFSKQIILSIFYLNYIKSWERVQQLYEEDVTLSTVVLGKNRGGIIVGIESLYGFIPNSHILSNKSRTAYSVGDSILVKFLDIDEVNNYIILSNKKVVLNQRYTSLTIGHKVQGSIRYIRNYGLFVEFDGLIGLAHVSEIDKSTSGILNDVFSIGDIITCTIIHLDHRTGRIALSTG